MEKNKIIRTARKRLTKLLSVLLALTILFELSAAYINAVTYYTVRVNYLYTDGTHAHDPYIATFPAGGEVDVTVTNPTINGYDPMTLNSGETDPLGLSENGAQAKTIDVSVDALNSDINLKRAVLNKASQYAYGSDSTQTRKLQVSDIPQTYLTNHDRVQYSKRYSNNYKIVNEEKTYTNGRYLLKATAYLIKDNQVTLSNSVYVCLAGEAEKFLQLITAKLLQYMNKKQPLRLLYRGGKGKQGFQ